MLVESSHLSILKEFFDNSKFIHIIRDPRDVALSYKKTWGKSLYYSSFKWNESLQNAIKERDNIGNDYLELKYEDLLNHPDESLRKIGEFIDCKFDDSHLKLSKSLETFGSTKGQSYIVSKNFNKWRRELTISQITKIEKLTKPSMVKLGYDFETTKLNYKRPGKLWLYYYQLYDFYKMYLFNKKNNLQMFNRQIYKELISLILSKK